MFRPSYLALIESGVFQKRLAEVKNHLKKCSLCPRHCEIDRFKYKNGFCKSGYLPIVSSFAPHFGEEPIISGIKGAGNVFFGNCNLRCVYCQNFEISQNWNEECKHEITIEQLSQIFLHLQNIGCHNIGLVSPTHFSVQILEAIFLAAKNGLSLPIIYNSNGYDSVKILKLFEGVIDIYLPDFKYGNNQDSLEYSNVPDYFDYAKLAIKEMHKQVSSKLVIEDDILKKGLIVRHLVLPNDLSNSENVLKYISEIDKNIFISLMSQYYPINKANNYVLLNRKLRYSEYEKVLRMINDFGLENGWIQEMESNLNYRPNFNNRRNPFNDERLNTDLHSDR